MFEKIKMEVSEIRSTMTDVHNQLSSLSEDNSKSLYSTSSDYKEAKETKQNEKLQRKIERRQRARYKSRKYFVSLSEIRDEVESYFHQIII